MFEDLLFELRAASRSCSSLADNVKFGLIVLLLAMVVSMEVSLPSEWNWLGEWRQSKRLPSALKDTDAWDVVLDVIRVKVVEEKRV